MKITEIPFAALRLQYRIARVPLRLFEQRVLARVDSEAPARLLYERSVGAVDVRRRQHARRHGGREAWRCARRAQ